MRVGMVGESQKDGEKVWIPLWTIGGAKEENGPDLETARCVAVPVPVAGSHEGLEERSQATQAWVLFVFYDLNVKLDNCVLLASRLHSKILPLK